MFPALSGFCFWSFSFSVFRRLGFRRRFSSGRVSSGGFPAAGFPAAVFRRPGFRLRFCVHGFPVFVSVFVFGRFRLPISGVLRPVSAQPAAGTNSTTWSPGTECRECGLAAAQPRAVSRQECIGCTNQSGCTGSECTGGECTGWQKTAVAQDAGFCTGSDCTGRANSEYTGAECTGLEC